MIHPRQVPIFFITAVNSASLLLCICTLKLPVVSPQVWEGGMCKDNTLGTVQETLLGVEHKYHLFVEEYLEKRRTGEMENTGRDV